MSTMEVLDQIKQTMDRIVEIEYSNARRIGAQVDRKTLKTEFLAAGVYVAGADNNISSIEVDLLNYLFDYDLSPQEMGPVIRTMSELYNDLIIDLQLAGWAICKSIDAAQGSNTATEAYIQTMKAVMKLFGAVDGNLDIKEEKFIQDYINRLERDR